MAGATKRRIALAFVVIFPALVPRPASGQEVPPSHVEEARAAYAKGAAAFDAGRFSEAATELARADTLAPNDTALEVALHAVVRTDLATLAMELAERAQSHAVTPAIAELARRARDRFAEKVGRVRISCPPPCTARLDGDDVDVGTRRWVTTGEHTVEMNLDGRARVERRTVRVASGESIVVEPALVVAPPDVDARPPAALGPTRSEHAEPEPAPPAARGVSPVVFWTAAGLTTALAAVTLASALDTRSKHEAFAGAPTVANGADGQASQTRTNVLFAATGLAGLATGVMGAFFVRW
jgi:hypothetical protein